MKIIVAIDPLPQSRPRFCGGRCYEESRIKKYKIAVGEAARKAMRGKTPLEDEIQVKISCFRKYKRYSRRYGDVDNLLKAVLDACSGILFLDDSQVISATVEKYESEKPRLEIEVL